MPSERFSPGPVYIYIRGGSATVLHKHRMAVGGVNSHDISFNRQTRLKTNSPPPSSLLPRRRRIGTSRFPFCCNVVIHPSGKQVFFQLILYCGCLPCKCISYRLVLSSSKALASHTYVYICDELCLDNSVFSQSTLCLGGPMGTLHLRVPALSLY